MPAGPPVDHWNEEKDFREREVKATERSGFWQRLIALAALLAALVAVAATVVASVQASRAISVAQQSIERQGDDARLSTAVTAIGGSGAVEQLAGLSCCAVTLTRSSMSLGTWSHGVGRQGRPRPVRERSRDLRRISPQHRPSLKHGGLHPASTQCHLRR